METTYYLVDNYYGLIHNLSDRAKIELIQKISLSLLEKKDKKQEQLLRTFGTFVSEEPAEHKAGASF